MVTDDNNRLAVGAQVDEGAGIVSPLYYPVSAGDGMTAVSASGLATSPMIRRIPGGAFEVDEDMRSLLVMSLRVAAEKYEKDADVMAKDGFVGYQAIFTQQALDTRALADRLEDPESIRVGEDAPMNSITNTAPVVAEYRDMEDAAREAAAKLTKAQLETLAFSVDCLMYNQESTNVLLRGFSLRQATTAKLAEKAMIVNNYRFTESERAALALERDQAITRAKELLNAPGGEKPYAANWLDALAALTKAKDAQDGVMLKRYILTPIGIAVGKLGAK